MNLKNTVFGGLLGLAVGDAFGVPAEFLSRKEVCRLGLNDMAGCDTDPVIPSRWGEIIPAGAWSDDTSMTVAAIASLIDSRGSPDYGDVMDRFVRWWENGEYCAVAGSPFGLGGCVARALARYRRGVPAVECGGTGFGENGNGSLMRIFPFSMLCLARALDDDRTFRLISDASGITHAHDISKMSCFIYTLFLRECLQTKDPRAAYEAVSKESGREFSEFYGKYFSEDAIEAVRSIRKIDPTAIGENGYVVNSLKIALYSLVHTDSYGDAVRMAVNFGYDTDTNGAITGSIAGSMYGTENIPVRWLARLKRREALEKTAEAFSDFLESLFRGNGTAVPES